MSEESKTVDLTVKQIIEFRHAINFLGQVYREGPRQGLCLYDVGNDVSYALMKTSKHMEGDYEAIDAIRKQLEAKRAAANIPSVSAPSSNMASEYRDTCKALGLQPDGEAETNFVPEPESEWGKLLASKRTVTPHRFDMKDLRPGCATIPRDIFRCLAFMIREPKEA